MQPIKPTERVSVWILLAVLMTWVATPAQGQPPPRETRLFQINLLLASRSGESDLEALPANTRKAIEDIRDFLPFQSYRTLDTGLIRSSGHSRTTLRGPGDDLFEVYFSFRREIDRGDQLHVNTFGVRRKSWPRPAESSAESADPGLAPPAPVDTSPLISSSFTAPVGRTVVVGSSRLDGGREALVVLFTALP